MNPSDDLILDFNAVVNYEQEEVCKYFNKALEKINAASTKFNHVLQHQCNKIDLNSIMESIFRVIIIKVNKDENHETGNLNPEVTEVFATVKATIYNTFDCKMNEIKSKW